MSKSSFIIKSTLALVVAAASMRHLLSIDHVQKLLYHQVIKSTLALVVAAASMRHPFLSHTMRRVSRASSSLLEVKLSVVFCSLRNS
jgi:uncharacterized membrane protein